MVPEIVIAIAVMLFILWFAWDENRRQETKRKKHSEQLRLRTNQIRNEIVEKDKKTAEEAGISLEECLRTQAFLSEVAA